jgi:hypothetical protein
MSVVAVVSYMVILVSALFAILIAVGGHGTSHTMVCEPGQHVVVNHINMYTEEYWCAPNK